MSEEKSTYDMDAILFSQLILSFQASAMQQMGKIMNPFTQKIERDLSQAKMSIEMLAMIQEKTKGNLAEEESRLLDRVLFELRMNYVDEVNKEKEKTKEGEMEEGETIKESTEGMETESETEDATGEERPSEVKEEAAAEKKEVKEKKIEEKETKRKTKAKKGKKTSAQTKSKTDSAKKKDPE